MKIYFSCFVVMLVLLSSCDYPTTAHMERLSPSGKVKVDIEANRVLPTDPWKVIIKIKAYSFKEGQLSTEVVAKNIDNKTVNFNWFEESSADITFTQKDGSVKVFRLVSKEEQLQFAQVPPGGI